MVYLGSKNRISKELAPIIQGYINKNTKGYLEPFVGGANMIDKIICKNKYGCDIHKELIALLNHVQKTTDDIPKEITEIDYKYIKENKDNFPLWFVGLVGFCASYGGIFFSGYAKGKNSNGEQRNYAQEAFNNLNKQAPNLKNITFKNCSFLDINKNIKDYVIYCDPPYRDTTKYKTEDFPYDEFYNWCIEMSKNNIVLISEYSMPPNFKCIWEKETRVNFSKDRGFKSENTKRVEKLFIVNCEEKTI